MVMNPSQTFATIPLPHLNPDQPPLRAGKVQFRDAGFTPQLNGDHITLGPGQMAMVGFGAYAEPAYDFGIQRDVVIPRSIDPVKAEFRSTSPNTIEASIQSPANGWLRVIMRQRLDGRVYRTHGGAPPNGTSMGKIFTIEAIQAGRTLAVATDYDRVIWSGLSWALGEIKLDGSNPHEPIEVRIHSADKDAVELEGKIYRVVY